MQGSCSRPNEAADCAAIGAREVPDPATFSGTMQSSQRNFLPPPVAGLRAAIAGAVLVAVAAAQDARVQTVRELCAKASFAEALVVADAALRDEPQSVDWCFVRAELLLGLERWQEAASALAEAERLSTARQRALRARLDGGRQASAAPPAPPRAPARSGSDSTREAGGSEPAGQPPAAPKRSADAALLAAIVQAQKGVTDAGESRRSTTVPALAVALTRGAEEVRRRREEKDDDRGDELLEVVFRNAELHPEASLEALRTLTQVGDDAVVARAKEKLLAACRALAAAVVALFEREDEAGAAQQGQTLERGLRILGDLHLEADGVRSLQGMAQSRQAAAWALRRLGTLMDRWAARIETIPPQEEDHRDQEVVKFLDAAGQLHQDPATESSGEDGALQLRKSGVQRIADRAREVLLAFAELRAARGRRAEAAGDHAAAAKDLERAFVCDPDRRQEGLDAGRWFETVGALGRAAVVYKRLIASGIGTIAEQSQQRFAAMWERARANVTTLPPANPTQMSAAAVRQRLQAVAAALPVLEGEELEGIRRVLDQGLVEDAAVQLGELVEGVRTKGPAGPAAPVLDQVPHLGEAFSLTNGRIAGAWIAPVGENPGFWLGRALVNREAWESAVTPAAFRAREEADGCIDLSWNNAAAFCARLTERERAANRLPADYVYCLPTLAELERGRDPVGKLPGPSNRTLWTADREVLSEELSYVTTRVDRPGRFQGCAAWRAVPNLGFLIVLARRP